MTTWDSGLIVYIHNNSFRPVSSDAVYIEPGKQSIISVKRTYTQKYPSPYSDCIDLTSLAPSDLFSFIRDQNQTYRQQDCFNLCMQRDIIDKCKCYDLNYANLNRNNVKPCLNLSEYACLNEIKKNFDVELCRQVSCPLECNSIKYDLGLSSLLNPHLKEYNSFSAQELANYERVLGANLTYDLFRSAWVNLKVYYPTLQYTYISETPKVSLIDLCTQIGGSLGMFVSFSVFTLFELIEILVLVLYEYFKKKRATT
jgi:hypothetical protein